LFKKQQDGTATLTRIKAKKLQSEEQKEKKSIWKKSN
jgi:hypothetical protein